MHVREMVDVAGVVAYNGPQIIMGAHSLATAPLEQYWAVSKCRFESWNRSLKSHAALAARQGEANADEWLALRATLEEIFISEILVRAWTAVLVGRDREMGTAIDEPLARSVFDSHMEARHRALKLLLDSSAFSTSQAVAINRVRRKAERWSDVLLGGMMSSQELLEFAVDAERAADFSQDLARRRRHPDGRHAWQLTLASLRGAFQLGVCPLAANPDTNARVTASVLGCLPAELFDSTGLLKSLWMVRLSAVTSDAQGLIEELLQADSPAPLATLRRGR